MMLAWASRIRACLYCHTLQLISEKGPVSHSSTRDGDPELAWDDIAIFPLSSCHAYCGLPFHQLRPKCALPVRFPALSGVTL
jgi:hypothetical protein